MAHDFRPYGDYNAHAISVVNERACRRSTVDALRRLKRHFSRGPAQTVLNRVLGSLQQGGIHAPCTALDGTNNPAPGRGRVAW